MAVDEGERWKRIRGSWQQGSGPVESRVYSQSKSTVYSQSRQTTVYTSRRLSDGVCQIRWTPESTTVVTDRFLEPSCEGLLGC